MINHSAYDLVINNKIIDHGLRPIILQLMHHNTIDKEIRIFNILLDDINFQISVANTILKSIMQFYQASCSLFLSSFSKNPGQSRPKSQNGQIPAPAKIESSRPRPKT